jgi:hypothetical protein
VENDLIGSNASLNGGLQTQYQQQQLDQSKQSGSQSLSDEYFPQGGSQSPHIGVEEVKKKRRFPLALKIIIPVFVVLVGATVFFWRSAAIAVVGTKNYYGLVELQNTLPLMQSISAPLAEKATQYHSYKITDNILMNSTDNIIGKAIVGTGIDPVKVLPDSTFEITLGKDTTAKSIVAYLDWKYKGSSLVNGEAYINKEKAVFNSQQMMKENVYITPADISGIEPLFGLSDHLITQTNNPIDAKALSKGFKDVFVQANSLITNKDVSIQRHTTGYIDGIKVNCDKIEVKLSAGDVRSILHRMLDTMDKNKSVKDFSMKFAPYLDAINNIYAVSGITPEIDYSYTGFSKAIDSADITGLTMTLLVKNSLFGTEVLSRDIKFDKGYKVLIYSFDGYDNGSIEISKLDNGNNIRTVLQVNYTNSKTSISGKILIPQPGELSEDASDKINFQLDKTKRTSIGFFPVKISLSNETKEGNNSYSVDTSPDGNGTKMAVVYKFNGLAQLTQNIKIEGSSEILTVPDFDPNNSIDPSADKVKLMGIQYELGENLNNILAKLGAAPLT